MSIISIGGILSLGSGSIPICAYYRSITINHTKCGSTDRTDFIYYADITDAALKSVANGGLVADVDHIRFGSNVGVTAFYKYNYELWDPTTGRIVFHIKIPSVSHTTDTVFYLAFDDNGTSTFQGDSANLYDAYDIAGVVHPMGYDSGGGVIGPAAANVSGASLVLTQNNTPTGIAGKVYGAAHFVASSSQDMSWNGSYSSHHQLTALSSLSCWYKPASFTDYRMLVANGSGGERNFNLYTDLITGKVAFGFTQGAGVYRTLLGTSALSTGNWYHIAATFDGSTQRLFINGVADGTNSVSGSPDAPPVGVKFRIGGIDGFAAYADGDIDEVRLAVGAARTADDWLTMYNNQNDPSTFSAVGPVSCSSLYQRTITIDHTKVPNTDRTDFICYVDITDTALKSIGNGGLVADVDHIRFGSNVGVTSLYKYDGELWDPVNGRIVYHVKIPSVSHTVDTVFYLAFDDNGTSTFQGDRANLYDAYDLAGIVYRMAYDSGGGTLAVDGGSQPGNSFGLSIGNAPTAVVGKVYGAAHLVAASSQHLTYTGSPSSHHQATSLWSVSCWYKPTAFGGYRTMVSNGDGSQRNFSFDTELTTGKVRFYFTQGSGNFKGFASSSALSTGTWYLVSATYDGTTQRIFINGVASGTNAVTGAPDSPPGGAQFYIGGLSGTTDWADGDVDEVRLAVGAARTADDWLTMYNNQNDPATFYTVT